MLNAKQISNIRALNPTQFTNKFIRDFDEEWTKATEKLRRKQNGKKASGTKGHLL